TSSPRRCTSTPAGAAGSAVDDDPASMSALLSRILFAAILIPPVLAAAWYGGVAMLVLALIAAGLGLHEYYRMARALRPIPLCGYAGGAGVVIAAYEASIVWTL